MMTNEEWNSHSKEWKDGFGAYNHGEEYDVNQSDEWKDGYRYAFEHFKGGLVPQGARA